MFRSHRQDLGYPIVALYLRFSEQYAICCLKVRRFSDQLALADLFFAGSSISDHGRVYIVEHESPESGGRHTLLGEELPVEVG